MSYYDVNYPPKSVEFIDDQCVQLFKDNQIITIIRDRWLTNDNDKFVHIKTINIDEQSKYDTVTRIDLSLEQTKYLIDVLTNHIDKLEHQNDVNCV